MTLRDRTAVASLSTETRQDDAGRWARWGVQPWHAVREVECNVDLVICECGAYCYRHEQRLVVFSDVGPVEDECRLCREARS